MKKDSYLLGVILVLLGGIFWGLSGVCGQYLFTHKGVSPNWLTALRLLVAGVALFLVLLPYKKISIFDIFRSKKSVLTLVFYGIFGLMICQWTYFLAIKYSNAAIATVLQYTAPALIIIYLSIVNKKSPTKQELFALVFAILGVFLLSTHGKFSFALPVNVVVIGVISACCVAIYSLAPIRLNKTYGTATSLSFGLIIGALASSLFVEDMFDFSKIDDINAILAFFGVVFFGTIVSFSFYMFGLNIIGPAKASMIASIEPLSSAIFAYLWLGSRFVFWDYVGFFLIISCTFILSFKK